MCSFVCHKPLRADMRVVFTDNIPADGRYNTVSVTACEFGQGVQLLFSHTA